LKTRPKDKLRQVPEPLDHELPAVYGYIIQESKSNAHNNRAVPHSNFVLQRYI